jgi:aryl-alcohol dehydrogenase-like predicted oxidoreductase
LQYVRLGSAGLKVSRICLGCMSFGNDANWKVEDAESNRVLKRAWDLGINYFDTSNSYAYGRSEEILGEFIKGSREDAVVATKVYRPMGQGPNQRGLSSKHIRWQFRESLRRLQTDYIDLYQTHRFDTQTPIEETLSTMTDLVRTGGIRYIGASSMWAWQFAKTLHVSDINGYARFVSMQDLYNLLYREEEREMIPLCKAEGVALVPWSPTAVGLLSGRFLKDGKIVLTGEDNPRNAPDSQWSLRYPADAQNIEIMKRVVEVAAEKGVTPLQVSLAWLLHRGVTAPIFGTRNPEHLEEAAGAVEVKLSDNEAARLEEPYRPRGIVGLD